MTMSVHVLGSRRRIRVMSDGDAVRRGKVKLMRSPKDCTNKRLLMKPKSQVDKQLLLLLC